MMHPMIVPDSSPPVLSGSDLQTFLELLDGQSGERSGQDNLSTESSDELHVERGSKGHLGRMRQTFNYDDVSVGGRFVEIAHDALHQLVGPLRGNQPFGFI